jgi:hypothetical protein
VPEHVHVHAPHELSEPAGASNRREHILEIVSAILLSLATVGIAWSGYQAARWSGFQAEMYTKASTARSLANRNSTIAAEQRDQDLLNFNRWLEVRAEGEEDLAALYERRFRREFRPAFEAWVASDPLHDEAAIASPLREQEYVLHRAVRAERMEKVADARFEAGRAATENADDYVFWTVFFAVVLFFAGISLRFQWFPMRVIILALGGGLLVYAAVVVLALPRH